MHDAQLDDIIRTRPHRLHLVLTPDVQAKNGTVPPQVFGPLQTRDFIQSLPGSTAKLCLIPGRKSESRQVERWATDLLRRTQCLHQCGRCPRTFEVAWRLVE